MRTTKTRQRLLEQLSQVAQVMVQGSLSRTTRTCGQPSCRCHTGQRHGPHTYLTFRKPDGRSSSLYVPAREEPAVRQAVAAWKRFGRLAAQLAEDNRQQIARRRRSKVRRTPNAR